MDTVQAIGIIATPFLVIFGITGDMIGLKLRTTKIINLTAILVAIIIAINSFAREEILIGTSYVGLTIFLIVKNFSKTSIFRKK